MQTGTTQPTTSVRDTIKKFLEERVSIKQVIDNIIGDITGIFQQQLSVEEIEQAKRTDTTANYFYTILTDNERNLFNNDYRVFKYYVRSGINRDISLSITKEQLVAIKKIFEYAKSKELLRYLIISIFEYEYRRSIDPSEFIKQITEKYEDFITRMEKMNETTKEEKKIFEKKLYNDINHDEIDMNILQQYTVYNETPDLIRKNTEKQHLHNKFMLFKKNPNEYFATRNYDLHQLQQHCASRFNEILKGYLKNNIEYETAKDLASKIVEIEYKSGLKRIEIEWPLDFSSVEGYSELKNFAFSNINK